MTHATIYIRIGVVAMVIASIIYLNILYSHKHNATTIRLSAGKIDAAPVPFGKQDFYPIIIRLGPKESYVKMRADSSIEIKGDTIQLIKLLVLHIMERPKVVIINSGDTVRCALGDTVRLVYPKTASDSTIIDLKS